MLVLFSIFSELREKNIHFKCVVQKNKCWDSSACLCFMFKQIALVFIDDYSNYMLGGEKTENGYSITADKTPKLCFPYLSLSSVCDIGTVKWVCVTSEVTQLEVLPQRRKRKRNEYLGRMPLVFH